MRPQLQALGRLKTGEKNRTEQRYGDHLDTLVIAGEVLWYKFEGLKLRLADNTFYTPDYVLLNRNSEIECHEVKGFWAEDARVKLKVAAALYPFTFVAIYAKPKRDGGGWRVEEF